MSTSYIRYPAASSSSSSFPLLAPDGSASAPSYANSTGFTGIYFSGEQILFSTNQVLAGQFDTSGNLLLGTTSAIGAGNEKLTALWSSDGSAVNSNAAAFRTHLTGNTAQTATARAIRAQYDRTITLDTTDTGAVGVVFVQSQTYTVSSTKTLTNANATGVNGLILTGPALSGGGALAISNYCALRIEANSVATGSNKVGIKAGVQSGATNNTQLLLGATTSPVGDYEIYSAGTGASLIGGSLQVNGTVGFNGQTPAARATYAASNVSTDRTYDASATTVAELANVLGTLIADLRAIGLVS